MSQPPEPSGPAPGEWVLFVVIGSDDPTVERVVTETLARVGIEVHVATADGEAPSVELDKDAARFIPVALSGSLDTSTAPDNPNNPDPPGPYVLEPMKALIFPGVPVAEDDPSFLHLALDDGGEWATDLVEALNRLGPA